METAGLQQVRGCQRAAEGLKPCEWVMQLPVAARCYIFSLLHRRCDRKRYIRHRAKELAVTIAAAMRTSCPLRHNARSSTSPTQTLISLAGAQHANSETPDRLLTEPGLQLATCAGQPTAPGPSTIHIGT